jgi:hypothetical protein
MNHNKRGKRRGWQWWISVSFLLLGFLVTLQVTQFVNSNSNHSSLEGYFTNTSWAMTEGSVILEQLSKTKPIRFTA